MTYFYDKQKETELENRKQWQTRKKLKKEIKEKLLIKSLNDENKLCLFAHNHRHLS